MDIKKLNRKEKEQLYIEKMTKLQRHWKNPIDDDWDFSDWTDEELNKGLEDTIGQLKFEMFFHRIGWFIKAVVLSFITLGVIGLLVFGIKQLF
jgi:hypothetical protein